jgi:YggT family protein
MSSPKGLGMLVFDTASSIALFLDIFLSIYGLTILVYILLSWFRLPYSLQPVQRFLYDVCEPYLALFRRLLPFLRFGAFDLSPLVALLALAVARSIVVGVLD